MTARGAMADSRCEQFSYQSEIGMFRDSEIPDPRLVVLGVKFGTIQELVEQEVKTRFS